MLSNFSNEQRLWEGAGNSRLLNMGELPALGALLFIRHNSVMSRSRFGGVLVHEQLIK